MFILDKIFRRNKRKSAEKLGVTVSDSNINFAQVHMSDSVGAASIQDKYSLRDGKYVECFKYPEEWTRKNFRKCGDKYEEVVCLGITSKGKAETHVHAFCGIMWDVVRKQ